MTNEQRAAIQMAGRVERSEVAVVVNSRNDVCGNRTGAYEVVIVGGSNEDNATATRLVRAALAALGFKGGRCTKGGEMSWWSYDDAGRPSNRIRMFLVTA